MAMILLFLVFFALQQTGNCQIHVLKTIDHKTGTYPFNKLNRKTKENVEIGRIAARVLNNNQLQLKYALLDVEFLSPGQAPERTKTTSGDWKQTAANLSNDDCNVKSLEKYPKYRRQFCIKHKGGEILTTKYFSMDPPLSGSRYNFIILYRAPPFKYNHGIPHSVTIFSDCDEMNVIYKNMFSLCQRNNIYKQNITNHLDNNIIIDGGHLSEFYLATLEIKPPLNLIISKMVHTVEINYTRSTYISNFTGLGTNWTYIAQFHPPFIVDNSKQISFSIYTQTHVYNISDWSFSFVYLKQKDFCSHDLVCQTLATQFYDQYKMYEDHCPNIDILSFHSKYGFCSDNPSPVIIKSVGKLDLDKLVLLKTSMVVLSNYTQDEKSPFKLNYDITALSTKYSSKVVNNTSSCAEYLRNNNNNVTSYFCIHPTTGNIYATKAGVVITPGEVFTLQLEVKDFSHFPPRVITPSITIETISVCTNTTLIIRNMFNNCNTSNDIKRFISTTTTSTVHTGLTILDASGVFYITGLYRKIGVQSMKADEFGSYIRLVLEDGSNSSETKHFFTGVHSSLTTPIKHTAASKYRLSASYYDIKTKEEKPRNFNVQDWYLVTIPQNDYCFGSTNCIALYNSYKHTYQSFSTQIDRACVDLDIWGFKAKYGFCDKYSALAVVKTDYKLRLNSLYVQTEIIPKNLPMYISHNNNLRYQLNEVRWNGKIHDHTNFTAKPKLCTSQPKSFFCINEYSGRIYTTADINGRLTNRTTFNLIILVKDNEGFPFRQKSVTLTLVTKDECSPASEKYELLRKCVDYKNSPTPILQLNALLFNIRFDFQSILGINFVLSKLNISTQVNKISFTVDIKRNGQVSYSITTEALMRSSFASLLSIFPFKLPMLRKIDQIFVKIFQHTVDDLKSPIQINPNVVNTFSLKYINTFQCGSSCLNTYNQWTVDAKKVNNAVLNISCTQDPLLYGRNFEVCADPQPEFKYVPLIKYPIKTGSTVTVSKCTYNSPYKMPISYWLKNGMLRINNTDDEESRISLRRRKQRSLLDIYPNAPEFTVKDLVLANITFEDQGYYQCVIEDVKVRKISKKVYLQLSDLSTTKVLIVIDLTWSGEYKNKNSAKFKDLENRLKTEVGLKLKSPATIKIEAFAESSKSSVAATIQVIYSGINKNKRLLLCEELQKELHVTNLGTLTIGSVQITNLDCCFKSSFGETNFKGIYFFNVTFAGTFSTSQDCKYGSKAKRKVRRFCASNLQSGPIWNDVDLSFCNPSTTTTKNLLELETEIVTVQTVEVVSKNLTTIVSNGSLTNTFDVKIISDVITKIVATNVTINEVTSNVLKSVDAILNTDETLIIQSNKQSNTSSNILMQLKKIAENQKIQDVGKPSTIKTKNIALGVIKPLKDKPLVIYSLPDDSTIDLNIHTGKSNNTVVHRSQAYINLPKEVTTNTKDNLIFTYAFRTGILFNKLKNSSLQSIVLSASVGSLKIVNLTKPIQLVFTAKKVTEKDKINVCKFWQPAVSSWSTKGCRSISNNVTKKVHCECDHLTNFAILLDVSQAGANPLTLQVITWIGCGLSLAGLVLTLITYIAFHKLRRSLPPKILVNLCISLMAVLIIFLAGAERTEPRVGCQIVASLLQYFILSTFCWMAVEGFNLYRMFVKVFTGGMGNTAFMIRASVISWGLPLIITIVTGVVKPDHLGPSSSTDPQFCVVTGTPFYFAVLLPVCVVLMTNLIVLILVLRGIKDGSKLVNNSKKERKAKFANVRIAFACSVLLGTTWLFAVMAVGELRDLFQWLFCIFNSLQGFFIFIFYTVRNTEARKQWKIFVGVKGLERSSAWARSKYNIKLSSAHHRTMSTGFSRSRTEKLELNNKGK